MLLRCHEVYFESVCVLVCRSDSRCVYVQRCILSFFHYTFQFSVLSGYREKQLGIVTERAESRGLFI